MMESGFGEIGDVFSLLSRSLVGRTVETFYGAKVVVPCNHALVRHYFPEAGHYKHTSPFHQDLAGVDPRARVTSWIPLEACGRSAPGLEIVDARVHDLIAVDSEGPDHGFGVSPARVLQRFDSAPMIHPEYAPGDVALFLNTTLHRTHVTAQMTAARLRLECRYLPQASLRQDEIASANFVPL
jgi:hypothetical protein